MIVGLDVKQAKCGHLGCFEAAAYFIDGLAECGTCRPSDSIPVSRATWVRRRWMGGKL